MQRRHWAGSACLLLGIAGSTPFAAEAPPNGAALYQQRCATCHESTTPIERMPTRATLGAMTPENILAAMTSGVMRAQSTGLSRDEMQAVATFVSGKSFGEATAAAPLPNLCKQPAAPIDLQAVQWNGWGHDIENSRSQPTPGLKGTDVPRLKVKWAYAYPGRSAYGQPTVIGDRVFVTSSTGEVSSLDARSGCAHWIYNAGTGVRGAVSVGVIAHNGKSTTAVLAGDEKTFVHALDAHTGAVLWKTRLEDHPVARITGAPQLHEGVLYVPLSSLEEVAARTPTYECCTFRGTLVAVQANTGKILWKSHVTREPPRPFKKNTAGTQMHGPAGGAIWSAPTVDAKRRLVYVATGNSYTDVANDGSDAVVAFDMQTGERKWVNQVTTSDNFLLGCAGANAGKNNCPEQGGPDHDIGASPILKTLPDGKQIILAGAKSGVVYGLDPEDDGKTLWRLKIGAGSPLGGVEWGMAADDEHVYVAISDAVVRQGAKPGVSALKLQTGEQVWYTPTPAVECSWQEGRCGRGQPGAVTAIPGIVFAGALDGHMRAYDTRTGAIVWDFDTAPDRDTVNGLKVPGGSIDAGGATIANGMVYVNSGYGAWGKMGRLLLAFSVDGK